MYIVIVERELKQYSYNLKILLSYVNDYCSNRSETVFIQPYNYTNYHVYAYRSSRSERVFIQTYNTENIFCNYNLMKMIILVIELKRYLYNLNIK